MRALVNIIGYTEILIPSQFSAHGCMCIYASRKAETDNENPKRTHMTYHKSDNCITESMSSVRAL